MTLSKIELRSGLIYIYIYIYTEGRERERERDGPERPKACMSM